MSTTTTTTPKKMTATQKQTLRTLAEAQGCKPFKLAAAAELLDKAPRKVKEKLVRLEVAGHLVAAGDEKWKLTAAAKKAALAD